MADYNDTTPKPAPDLAPVTPPASIDAELIGLAAEFQQTDARLVELNDELNADE